MAAREERGILHREETQPEIPGTEIGTPLCFR